MLESNSCPGDDTELAKAAKNCEEEVLALGGRACHDLPISCSQHINIMKKRRWIAAKFTGLCFLLTFLTER
jgi:hypothetical protein